MTDTLRARVLDTANVDDSIRPQDDFYRFVNGRWLATHEIPADRPVDGAFHALRDLSEERGRELAEATLAGTLDDPDAEKIAILYSQFMDEEAINEAGATPIHADLDAITSVTNKTELARLAGRLAREGIGSLFGVYVGTNAHDSTAYMTSIVQSGIGLPDESYYREDQYADIREAYVDYCATLLELAQYVEPDTAKAAAQRVMAVETTFASFHRDSVTNRDPLLSDNPILRGKLAETYPGFAWDEWAPQLGLPSDPDLLLNIDQPEFVEKASAAWEDADLEDLKLWLACSLIDARASLLSNDFVDTRFNFHGRILSGTQELRPRWKRALGLVEGFLGESLGRAWVAKHFPPSSKERMDQLVAALLAAYEQSIRSLDWMSDETKERALDKLSTFNPKIGYPVKWRDMSGLNLSADHTLVDNIRHAIAFDTEYEWAKLDRPVDRDEWFMTPQTVNAYYNPPMNEIVFPAAILQPPFFDAQADDAVNFGAIGAVIGHEIGHGFDDQGSRFDAQGNLENWWTPEDRARFESRTSVLVKQYDALVPADLAQQPQTSQQDNSGDEDELPHVNGALTIGENIGDLGGLSIAWKAWEATLAEQGLTVETAPIIDGLTGAERFFYAWARAWKTASRPQFARQMLAIDPHSPAEFRCNQVLRNLDAFVRTFDVREGDGMWLDPLKRVSIW
ncbi:M13-type metalloendopeptidase [Schaalia sp. ZJ1691]|uniref:M13 family metallopeptidase n=1 Tax=Schaalia sp. ZJ1691 TaxID=2709404 RepID=UPI0013ED8055|nr:M13-type metalloendopeptidase [Schaalia sp. ZJ1691]